MQRILLILFIPLLLLLTLQGYAQEKKAATTSTEQHLMELSVQQQYLEKKIDDQKTLLEDKFEVKKENLDHDSTQIGSWLNLLGIFIACIGIGLPIIGFILGRNFVSEVKTKINSDLGNELEGFRKSIKRMKDEANNIQNAQKYRLKAIESEILEQHKDFNKWFSSIKEQINNDCNFTKIATEQIKANFEISLYYKQNKTKNDNLREKDNTFETTNNIYNKYRHSRKLSDLKELDNELKNTTLDNTTKIEINYLAYEICYKNTNYTECLNYLNKILILQGDDFDVYAKIGNAYYLNDEFDKALKYLYKSTDLNPLNIPALIDIAYIFLELNNTSLAITYFKNTLEKNQFNENAIMGLGYCYFKEKEYNESINYYSQINGSSSHYSKAMANIASCYWLMSEFNNVILHLSKAIEFDNANKTYLKNISIAYLKIGEPDKSFDYMVKLFSNGDKSTIADLTEISILTNKDDNYIRSLMLNLKLSINPFLNNFMHELFNIIINTKNNNWNLNLESTFELLKKSTNYDSSRVKWSFEEIKNWLNNKYNYKNNLSSKNVYFLKDLIAKIENWTDTAEGMKVVK
jgi:tetratricopeptide (TPR) repeat protein